MRRHLRPRVRHEGRRAGDDPGAVTGLIAPAATARRRRRRGGSRDAPARRASRSGGSRR